MTNMQPIAPTGARPGRARLVLAIWLAATALFVGIACSPLASGFADAPSRGPSDIDLYWAEVTRIHSGQRYYDAAEQELTTRGYPTHSVFNWRLPPLVWSMAKAPSPKLGQIALEILAAAVIALACHLAARSDAGGIGQALMCGLVLVTGLLPCALGRIFILHELWAGVLITLSILLFSTEKRGLAVAAGLLALLIRELAAPYCVLCLILAARERRWKEVAAWVIGGTAYLGYFAWHAAHVLPRIEGLAHVSGTTAGAAALHQAADWVRFGGGPFVLSTVQMNGILLILPQWISGLFLTLALVGFAQGPSDANQRSGGLRLYHSVRGRRAAAEPILGLAHRPADVPWGGPRTGGNVAAVADGVWPADAAGAGRIGGATGLAERQRRPNPPILAVFCQFFRFFRTRRYRVIRTFARQDLPFHWAS